MVVKIGKTIVELKETDEKEKFTWDEAVQKANETGYKLPSTKELKLIYKSFHEKGIGGFENASYWTSDKNGKENAWYISFINGNDNWTLTSTKFNLRLIKVLG
jgi:hypothetical protein